jgi:hypothetical protein
VGGGSRTKEWGEERRVECEGEKVEGMSEEGVEGRSGE